LRVALGLAITVVFCVQLLAQVGALPRHDTKIENATDEKFHAGDVWEYKTRPGEESSTLTILKIDKSHELGPIVHVAVDNVRLRNCLGGNDPQFISHMPFAREALDASVTKLVDSKRALPNPSEGYAEWLAAYKKKHAGIYIVSVAQAVSVAEQTFQQGLGCSAGKTNKQSSP